MFPRAIFFLLAVGAIGTLGFIAYAADPGQPSSWWFLFLLAVWALLPYAIAAAAVRWQPASHASDSVLLLAAVLLAGLGTFGLYDAFILDPDPQSGLLLIFLPLWELLGLIPVVGISRFVARRGRPRFSYSADGERSEGNVRG